MVTPYKSSPKAKARHTDELSGRTAGLLCSALQQHLYSDAPLDPFSCCDTAPGIGMHCACSGQLHLGSVDCGGKQGARQAATLPRAAYDGVAGEASCSSSEQTSKHWQVPSETNQRERRNGGMLGLRNTQKGVAACSPRAMSGAEGELYCKGI